MQIRYNNTIKYNYNPQDNMSTHRNRQLAAVLNVEDVE